MKLISTFALLVASTQAFAPSTTFAPKSIGAIKPSGFDGSASSLLVSTPTLHQQKRCISKIFMGWGPDPSGNLLDLRRFYSRPPVRLLECQPTYDERKNKPLLIDSLH